MSFRQMEYLLAVVEEGSFTRAAQRLSVSQPALSHQIRALERYVGHPLLERLPDAVRLTPMGRAYLPHAIAALHSAEEAAHVARPRGEMTRIGLRIAALYSIALGIIPPAILKWRRRYPDSHVELLEFGNSADLANLMSAGGIDVAVSAAPLHWDGPVRTLGREELVVVLAKDDPAAAGRRQVRLAELASRPWVLYTPDNGLAGVVAQACSTAGFIARPAVHTHHTSTAVQLAAAGLGPALVPRNMIEADFGGVQLEPDPPVHRELVAFTTTAEVPHISAFIDILAEHGAIRSRGPLASPEAVEDLPGVGDDEGFGVA
ncbi:LysR family transcriptional regulator [Actinoallomurus iriomotensis]|uniref:LysR family transcriptional regulator n=1 Tax=Actinoallomurus iriomotensis TaxID=478107 RepID=A0A9W6W466_9ACTN|nr:LysR family transcriptional regulator [Actinoallomurus iriomotensis]GLY88686.1 LysR family transcriptional regulator [Actinoallomurus iriomotensis]